ncbi:substrate-binding domain-containing protein [Microbacterium tumbae]
MKMTTQRSRWIRAASAVGAAALSLAVLSACSSGMETPPPGAASSAPKDGDLTIAFLQKQGDQQYFIDEVTGARDAADALGGVTINAVDLGTDSNKAISEVEAAIAQQVDAIIIVVPDQQIGPQVIQLADDAGIPIMAADDTIEDGAGNPVPFTGFDGISMGEQVGEEAARQYQEAGWTAADTRILSAYKEDLSVCQQRVEGAQTAFTEAIDDAPEIIDVGTDNSVTDAQDKAGAVITANSGVQHWIVWGCNDESETGVVTALQNSGVAPADIIGVGLGAYLTCKDWNAGQDTGNKAALYISGIEVGKAAVNSMVALLRDGTPLPPQTIADTQIVDASNWEEAGVVCT